jgi:hypothetical protein
MAEEAERQKLMAFKQKHLRPKEPEKKPGNPLMNQQERE